MSIVDRIVAVFNQRGGEAYLGERVSMADHMLQAAYTAERSSASDEVVVAALLHDIGHLVNDVADKQRGAVALRRVDDAGKREGDKTPDLEHFLPRVRALITER